MIKSGRTVASSLIFSCLLIVSCKSISPARIVGSWYYKDFPGLTCEFKSNGTYHYAAVTKQGVTMSADGTYSVDGNKFTVGAPDVSPASSDDSAKVIIWGIMKRTIPPTGTIAWKSDDEFTVTSRNEMRGEDETVTWKRKK